MVFDESGGARYLNKNDIALVCDKGTGKISADRAVTGRLFIFLGAHLPLYYAPCVFLHNSRAEPGRKKRGFLSRALTMRVDNLATCEIFPRPPSSCSASSTSHQEFSAPRNKSALLSKTRHWEIPDAGEKERTRRRPPMKML